MNERMEEGRGLLHIHIYQSLSCQQKKSPENAFHNFQMEDGKINNSSVVSDIWRTRWRMRNPLWLVQIYVSDV